MDAQLKVPIETMIMMATGGLNRSLRLTAVHVIADATPQHDVGATEYLAARGTKPQFIGP